jgi:hypothetical protein
VRGPIARGKQRKVPRFNKTVLALHKKVILLALRYKEVILLTHFVVSGNGF